jgi:Exostosin family.
MKLLITDHQGWHSQGGPNPIDLPLNPDKIVCDIIEENIDSFDKNKTFVKMWFSKLYHDSGNNLQYVQNQIYKITDDNRRSDLVFICGHIIVNMLDFGKNKVLTYHGSIYNEHTVTIPMPAFNYSENPKDLNSRQVKASFAGSFDTHWSRRHIWYSLRNKDHCIVKDTGDWHYYKDKVSQTPDFTNFKDMLSNSVITLAPRGTGPCTIRLWESIESLSIPLIISDEYKNPKLGDISLDDMSIRVNECESQNVSRIIDQISSNVLKSKYNNLVNYIKKPYEERVLDTLKKELSSNE